MKLKSTITKGLFVFIYLFLLNYCTPPTADSVKDLQLESTGQKSDILTAQENAPVFQIDSNMMIQNHMKLSIERIKENTKNLNQLSSQFITEKGKETFAFQGEIFQLNKKNLKLKAQTANHLPYRGASWEGFKESLDFELDTLEASITSLKIRSEKYFK